MYFIKNNNTKRIKIKIQHICQQQYKIFANIDHMLGHKAESRQMPQFES